MLSFTLTARFRGRQTKQDGAVRCFTVLTAIAMRALRPAAHQPTAQRVSPMPCSLMAASAPGAVSLLVATAIRAGLHRCCDLPDCERRAALKDANSRVAVCRSFDARALCAELRASSRLPAYSHAAWGGETQGLACSITMLYAPRLTPWRACDSSACRARAARLYTRGPVPKPAARPEARYEPELTRVPGRGVLSAHRLCQLTATPLQWPTAS